MGAGSHSRSVTLGGRSLTRSATTSGTTDTHLGGTGSLITLTAGLTVDTWVKTDADTATCRLPADHGLTNGKFDVYASDGSCYRYGVDGTISGRNLSLDGGTAPDGTSGDVESSGFPATEQSGVIVTKQQQLNFSLDGDNAVLVGVETTCHAHVDMQDASSNTVRAFTAWADEPDLWDSGQAKNPYTGNPITKARVSNGSTTAGYIEILISVTAEAWLSPSSSPSTSVSGSPSTSPSSSVSSSPSSSPSSSVSSSPSSSVSSSPSSSVSSSPSSSVSSSPSTSPSSSPSTSPSAT